MSKYAGQKKVSKDIDKKVKRAKSSKKSNDKKKAMQNIYYYNKLLNAPVIENKV